MDSIQFLLDKRPTKKIYTMQFTLQKCHFWLFIMHVVFLVLYYVHRLFKINHKRCHVITLYYTSLPTASNNQITAVDFD